MKELPALFEKKDHTVDLIAAHEQQVEELYSEIGRLTTQVAWLKKNLVSTLPRAKRRALIDCERDDLSLVVQAELLGLSRASLYYKRVSPSAHEIAIKHRIDELYTAHPFYGSRRLGVCLHREGLIVNRKAERATHAGNGHCRHLSIAELEQKRVGASSSPISAAWRSGGPARPYLGHRYYLHQTCRRLVVSGRRA